MRHWDNYFDPRLEHNGRMVATRGYITDVLTDAAIRFIRQHRDRPFFCYVPYNAPHTPLQVADAYFDKYKARGCDDRTAAIYGMVENIDGNVGRLLEKLDGLNLAGNTVVIFLSDNGPEGAEGSRYNAGMRGMKGRVRITVKALNRPGDRVCDLKSIWLRKVDGTHSRHGADHERPLPGNPARLVLHNGALVIPNGYEGLWVEREPVPARADRSDRRRWPPADGVGLPVPRAGDRLSHRSCPCGERISGMRDSGSRGIVGGSSSLSKPLPPSRQPRLSDFTELGGRRFHCPFILLIVLV